VDVIARISSFTGIGMESHPAVQRVGIVKRRAASCSFQTGQVKINLTDELVKLTISGAKCTDVLRDWPGESFFLPERPADAARFPVQYCRAAQYELETFSVQHQKVNIGRQPQRGSKNANRQTHAIKAVQYRLS
jgi:hypothetical protein